MYATHTAMSANGLHVHMPAEQSARACSAQAHALAAGKLVHGQEGV